MDVLPISKNTEEITSELMELGRKALDTIHSLSQLENGDIQIGVSEKEAVFTLDHITLYHYKPSIPNSGLPPLLISYALVNRPYMVDLQEDRSLVRNLLDYGLDVYLIDWGYPKRNDRWITLGDYVNYYIDSCVDHIREAHHLNKINLIGICQGGVLGLCYAALHAEKIANLITTVTPVDFHVDIGLLNFWMRNTEKDDTIDPRLMVEAFGNIPGDLINLGFLMLKPFELGLQKYLNLIESPDHWKQMMNFLRLEKWIFDNPDQIGETWRQYIEDFYMHNRLIKGEVILDGQRVDLSKLTMPILNIYAEQDHLVPPASTTVLKDYANTDDYTEAAFPVGHVGIYVSSKVQRALPQLLHDWLRVRK